MKILILGGTGLVGRALVGFLSKENEIKAFGRGIYQNGQLLQDSVEWSDVLIQLSGATISKRWTSKYKQEIWDSRIKTNQQLATIFSNIKNKPKVIFASAVGFYPESNCDNPFNESHMENGSDYLSLLAKEWESEAYNLSDDVLIFRFGVVLSLDGGALKEMLPMYKLGLGGPIGTGEQCFTWIHIKDLVRAINYSIVNNLKGVYNLNSPGLVSQNKFGKALSNAINRPFLFRTFEWQLRLIFGEGGQVLVKSLAASPKKLIDSGFVFEYTKIENALEDII
tara:strand:+ start:530 stop:1372 length:843 start_codon:yes stop_codon:yes gene_type:complete